MTAPFRCMLAALACVGTTALAAPAGYDINTSAGPVRVTHVASGLAVPWALAFLPDGRMLVSERAGRLRVISPDGARSAPLPGVPAVHAQGQGGLLDIALAPDFADSGMLYLAYAESLPDGGARTAVGRGRLVLEPTPELRDFEQIFAQNEAPPGRHHFGARLVFDRAGHLFVTLGERYHPRERAQALDSHLGKVVRITVAGGVPTDNPYARGGALPEIWTYGHRNVQGAALNPVTGHLWTHEHGPQGGDEVNVHRPGQNHGWPVITFGREYVTGWKIGEGGTRADVTAPLWQWTPSIAPSGMAFHSGAAFPAWRGDLFVGSLKFGELVRLDVDGERILGEERLLSGRGLRIRDVREGPDGALYLLDESEGAILRLAPAP